VRRFWRGDENLVRDLASRISGSSDIFGAKGRRPWASVNFITAHDGFTLRDLVSYESKHNLLNGEDNRDGSDSNNSWNCGHEGRTAVPAIRTLRMRQMRNLMATLLLSQGVPMITAGDEFGRTQHGNNNAYCQDSEVGWLDWEGIDEEGRALLEFVLRLVKLRRDHIVFHRNRFFQGRPLPGNHVKDIHWLRPDGNEKTWEDWGVSYARCLSFVVSGEAGEYHLTERGEPQPDDTFLAMMNAGQETLEFQMPAPRGNERWHLVFDTAEQETRELVLVGGDATYSLRAHSFALFVCPRDDRNGPAPSAPKAA